MSLWLLKRPRGGVPATAGQIGPLRVSPRPHSHGRVKPALAGLEGHLAHPSGGDVRPLLTAEEVAKAWASAARRCTTSWPAV